LGDLGIGEKKQGGDWAGERFRGKRALGQGQKAEEGSEFNLGRKIFTHSPSRSSGALDPLINTEE